MLITVPEHFKVVGGGPSGGPIVAADALSTGDYISLANVHRATCIVVHNGANDTDLTVSFMKATDIAGSGAAAVTSTQAIWRDNDAGSQSDTLVRQTDAANAVIDPATQNPVIAVFQIDPAKLGATYDAIACKGAGGHASNDVCVLWLLEMRHAADQPPAVIA